MKIKTAYLGMLLAFALILSYIEAVLPLSFGIPGIKLGLANLAVVLALYLLGTGSALLLTIMKALLAGFMFGNMTMLLYSLAGALWSFMIMAWMKKSDRFHLPVVSAAGGVMHNIGQILVAYLTVKTYGILYYIPILILAGLVTGILIGITADLVKPYAQKIMEKGNRL
jgi:heptaprenyl diphosphate synthase